MHTFKSGYSLLTFFFITMIMCFIGVAIIRSYACSTNIAQQQYNYWRNYYTYEGCLEYVFAYFCNDFEMMPDHITFCQKNGTYEITLNKKIFQNTASLKGEIVYKDKTAAHWDLFLERLEKNWVIKKRNLTLKSLY